MTQPNTWSLATQNRIYSYTRAKSARLRLLMLFTASMLALSAMAAPPPATGSFVAADFTPPDFSDGGGATVSPGASATFTYSCLCGDGRKDAPCSGTMRLERDDGSGFVVKESVGCNVAKGEGCMATSLVFFPFEGVSTFRIACDESTGVDFTQGSSEYVTVTAESTGCTLNETRPCALQEGVCAGSVETCVSGSWPGCDYGTAYEEPEASCDSLDNDCDGTVDNVDFDGDGVGLCPGLPGVINELLLTNSNGDGGAIQIFEFRDGAYQEAWSTSTLDVPILTSGGGEAGDLTGDSIPEFALVRSAESTVRLEVWTPDGQSWSLLWSMSVAIGYGYLGVGDILDADGDGLNELLVTNRNAATLELYGYDGNGFALEATIQDCSENGAFFLAAGGDMDGDGLPEIAFQCYTPDTLHIYEYAGGTYPVVAEVVLPGSQMNENPMIIDDMEHGDVNGDGLDDIVFCGNSGQVHVLTATNQTYAIEYSSPAPADQYSFSQTCSVGDVTGDGQADILVVNKEGAKVYSHNGAEYVEVWVGSLPTTTPGLGTSFIGDANNDGRAEFLFGDGGADVVRLFEGTASFENTFSFGELTGGISTIIVADLNHANDETPIDCNDENPLQGFYEVCGDFLDNDCDMEIDEGCPSEYCGNDYCAGANLGETCNTCAADCGCYGPGCRFGCCGDYTCGKNESATNCPVDCS